MTKSVLSPFMSTEAVSSPSLGELVERSLCTSRVPSSRPSQVSGGFCCDEIKSVEIYKTYKFVSLRNT